MKKAKETLLIASIESSKDPALLVHNGETRQERGEDEVDVQRPGNGAVRQKDRDDVAGGRLPGEGIPAGWC